MSTFIAVDIGGTHIRAAAYESDNTTPLTHKRTRSHAKEPGTFDRLVKARESVRQCHRNGIPGSARPTNRRGAGYPQHPRMDRFSSNRKTLGTFWCACL